MMKKKRGDNENNLNEVSPNKIEEESNEIDSQVNGDGKIKVIANEKLKGLLFD
jgi:hypothetical protein